jgi:hypothetical protein
MKKSLYALLLLGMLQPSVFTVIVQAQLNQAIIAKFPVTKATADRTDIVTAGSVMDLKQDGLMMFAIDTSSKAQLVYKDGKIQPTTMTKMATACLMGHGAGCGVVHRAFVAGEKVWLIDVQTVSDGVQLTFLSDAINDVRYMAVLKIPFPKGSSLSADEAIKQISQVINPEPGSDAQPAAAGPAPEAAPPAAAAAAPPPPPMADIPPPPPPTDAPAAPPKTISLGQTKDQVATIFGQPTKIVKLGTKEIDYYPDMKVTFTSGKVTDVQ